MQVEAAVAVGRERAGATVVALGTEGTTSPLGEVGKHLAAETGT